MGAIFSLFDFATRTPDQTIRVFYKLYDQESVRQQLWESFRGFATNDEKESLGLLIEEKEVALLFDQIIDLVGAVQALQNTKREKCFFCGRVDPISPEQA